MTWLTAMVKKCNITFGTFIFKLTQAYDMVLNKKLFRIFYQVIRVENYKAIIEIEQREIM